MSAVLAANGHEQGRALAEGRRGGQRDDRLRRPGSVGRRPYWTANRVSPMNRMPSRIDIAVIVLAAFFASGGLNAGTPLAMASTPVSATEPPAKALSSRRMPIGSSGSRERHGVGLGTAGRPSRR